MTTGTTYQPQASSEKKIEILEQIQGYWMNDIWYATDVFFEPYGGGSQWTSAKRKLNFTLFPPAIRQEMKYFFSTRLLTNNLTLYSCVAYAKTFNHLATFSRKYYPKIHSFLEMPYGKSLIKYKHYLASAGVGFIRPNGLTGNHIIVFNQVQKFLRNFYDTRDELEKDVWDVRNIPNATYTKSGAHYLLRFDNIHPVFRETVKKYMKFEIVHLGQGSLSIKLVGIRNFVEFLRKHFPQWTDFTNLQRSHIEEYLIYFQQNFGHLTTMKSWYLHSVKHFIEYLQRSEQPEAPFKPVYTLFFKEDFPKPKKRNVNEIKYIPESVINQLEMILGQNIDQLDPPMTENDKQYVPIVILLMATGWRIGDILNLRYHNCLVKSNKGFYLQGDIPKTDVRQHRVPIDNDIALILQATIEQTKKRSSTDNNPKKYLFVRTKGSRKGEPFDRRGTQRALNRWAKKYNIIDHEGNIYHFGNHAFRHTKGVELINLGMNLTHIMKWFAHSSPEMTLTYAKIQDDTLRKEWEKAQEKKSPLLRISLGDGQVKEMELDEDVIHWEYIRSNVEAARVPLGFCLASKKEGCPYVVTPCLTCSNFCTTPDNLPDFEREIQRVEEHIQITQNYPIYNEKTKEQLNNLIKIRDQLAEGKSHRGDSAKKILFDAQITKEKVLHNET